MSTRNNNEVINEKASMKRNKMSLEATEILKFLIASSEEIRAMDSQDAITYIDQVIKKLSGKVDREFVMRARTNAQDNAELLKMIMNGAS